MAEGCQPYDRQPAPFPDDETNSHSHPAEHGTAPSTSFAHPNFAAPTASRPPPTTSRRGRPEGKPPRPMNAWLIFRTAQLKLLKEEDPEGPRKSQGEMSKIIAERWRNVDPQTRQEYEAMAKERKEEFRQAYPDYRYGPHKPKEKTVKARNGLPDLPTSKRSLPKPNLRLGGTGSITHPDSRENTDSSTTTRTVRVVSAPDLAKSATSGAFSSLPTPVSAHSRWSREQQLHLPPPLSHHVERDAPRDAAEPSHFSSALPSSAPAASSSFQSSLASLGASISSLAQPTSHYQQSEEDRFRRHIPIAEHRQVREPGPQFREAYGRDAAAPGRGDSYRWPHEAQPEAEMPYHGQYPTPRSSFDAGRHDGASAEWHPRESSRTSYYAMAAYPPQSQYSGEPQSELGQLSDALVAPPYNRGPDGYGQLGRFPAAGQHVYDRPESQSMQQSQQWPPLQPDRHRLDSQNEDRPNTQLYEAGSAPRWRADLHGSM